MYFDMVFRILISIYGVEWLAIIILLYYLSCHFLCLSLLNDA